VLHWSMLANPGTSTLLKSGVTPHSYCSHSAEVHAGGFLAWLEVLSVIGAARGAVIALDKLMPGYRRFVLVHSTVFHDTHVYLNQVTKDHQLLDTAQRLFPICGQVP
jgi:hypothetical protein